jgi:putative ABC transport system ATP-binding protein
MDRFDPTESHGPAVTANALEMTYGAGSAQVRAIREVSFAVPPGQFLVVRGRSGSGKTTLCHLIAGLRRPTEGRVMIGEVEIQKLSEADSARFRRRHIGLVYQFFNLVPTLSVAHNIALPLLMDGYHLAQVRDKVHRLMERLEIEGRDTQRTHELSGGEMQRVAIARALVADPLLLLADEPTGNLDSYTGSSVLTLFRDLCDERGVTTILLTHDVEATAYADRVIVLRDGEIEEDTGVIGAAGRDPES